MEALRAAAVQGDRAVLLFLVGTEGGCWVEPAEDVDPTYAAALRNAASAGVEVLAWRLAMDRTGLELGESVPVRL